MLLLTNFINEKFYGQFTNEFNPSIINDEFIDKKIYRQISIIKLTVNLLTNLIR